MTITNVSGLPEAFVNVAKFAWYDHPEDHSTTTRLIKPPRMVALFNRHKDEISVDVQEMAWTLLGGAVHMLLEKAAGENVIVETRIRTEIEGWKISGKPDAYYPAREHIDDFKVTSVYAFQREKPEWEQQNNLNAMLHRLKEQPVKSLQIICILRDWMRRKAQYSDSYPQFLVQPFGVPTWSQADCKDFARLRVKLHQSVLGLSDDELPMCTDEERWFRGGNWAVFKTDGEKVNKRAVKLCDSKDQALKYMAEHPITPAKRGKVKTYTEPVERPGEYIRCLDYCEARHFCSFGKKVMAERAERDAQEPLVDENEENE